MRESMPASSDHFYQIYMCIISLRMISNIQLNYLVLFSFLGKGALPLVSDAALDRP